MGRHSKPAFLKRLEGNPGNRPIRKEPELEPLHGVMDPPDFLDDIAQREWRRTMPVLISCGLLTAGDLPAFEIYCSTYARWRRAEAELKALPSCIITTPTGRKQASPWHTISIRAGAQMRALMIEFGLSPAARSRMGLPEPPPAGAPSKLGGRFAHLIGSNDVDKKPN